MHKLITESANLFFYKKNTSNSRCASTPTPRRYAQPMRASRLPPPRAAAKGVTGNHRSSTLRLCEGSGRRRRQRRTHPGRTRRTGSDDVHAQKSGTELAYTKRSAASSLVHGSDDHGQELKGRSEVAAVRRTRTPSKDNEHTRAHVMYISCPAVRAGRRASEHAPCMMSSLLQVAGTLVHAHALYKYAAPSKPVSLRKL